MAHAGVLADGSDPLALELGLRAGGIELVADDALPEGEATPGWVGGIVLPQPATTSNKAAIEPARLILPGLIVPPLPK